MSYCRFSSDDFMCDLHVYESAYGGYSVSVSHNRVLYKEPIPEYVSMKYDVKWLARNKKIMDMLAEADIEPIGLSHDGNHYSLNTATECCTLLFELKEEGYNVPKYVIEGLLEDIYDER